MQKPDVLVIGGGPAGMMAAGQAAERGRQVLLLEKMESPGRKLLLTGKNRCNLTNTDRVQEFLDHFNPSGKFLTQLFYRFFNQDLREFFHRRGVPTAVQRGGRVFPASEEARDVLDALLDWLHGQHVEIRTSTPAQELMLTGGRITGVKTPQGAIQARAVILAAGGKAYPGTGSTGDGYDLARQAGHRIIPVRPALVPLVTRGETAQRLQGLSLENIRVSLWVDGTKETDLFGEMLFTHFGVSGPVILTLSRTVVDHLREGRQVELAVDLKPALDHPTLDRRLLRDIQAMGRKQYSTLLEGLLPKSLLPVCVDQTGVAWDKTCSQITAEERKRLRMWLKEDFRLEVADHRGFEQAIITAGGVDVAEVDPHTMASRLGEGLYLAGEILDVDGDTGGYNLQAAFSTGWAAGLAAAEAVRES